MDNEIAKQMWPVLKGILAIVEQQQNHLAVLSKSHFGLLDALRSESGLDSSPAAAAIDQGSVERAKAEVAELEKLFGREGGAA